MHSAKTPRRAMTLFPLNATDGRTVYLNLKAVHQVIISDEYIELMLPDRGRFTFMREVENAPTGYYQVTDAEFEAVAGYFKACSL